MSSVSRSIRQQMFQFLMWPRIQSDLYEVHRQRVKVLFIPKSALATWPKSKFQQIVNYKCFCSFGLTWSNRKHSALTLTLTMRSGKKYNENTKLMVLKRKCEQKCCQMYPEDNLELIADIILCNVCCIEWLIGVNASKNLFLIDTLSGKTPT